jgi:predicted NACHT family NTPase
VIDQHGKLEPPDFDRRRRVPIADIYVPTTINKDLSPERAWDAASGDERPLEFHNRAVRIWALASGDERALNVYDLAERLDRSVLLGDPGGGKTTAANVLMHHFADTAGRVPFLVTLRDYAAKDPLDHSIAKHIEAMLETFYQCPAPAGLVDLLLLTGRAVVIFDGLDELLDTSRRADVTARVERFCAARRWFAQDNDAHQDDAATFLDESAGVPDLRCNPLLLSLMCILYRGRGSLPRDRAGVYEQCADLLSRRWDARRRIYRELRAGHLVEPALRHLAWWLFTRDVAQPVVTERDLVEVSTGFLQSRGFEVRVHPPHVP